MYSKLIVSVREKYNYIAKIDFHFAKIDTQKIKFYFEKI